MTWPTITPIGFMSPPRSFSATSGLASSAARTIGASSSPPPTAPRPSASTIARRVAAVGDRAMSSTCLAPRLRDRLVGDELRRAWRAPPARPSTAPGPPPRAARRARSSSWPAAAAPSPLPRGQRGLEVVAELGAPGEQPRAVGAEPELAGRSARSRAAGSSGIAARARSSIASVIVTGGRSGSGK